MEDSNLYKVRLESYSHGITGVPTSEVQFNVMPTISESIAVEYQALDPVHMPGSFYVYKGTKSSIYELGEIRLISRSSVEATENQTIRNTLRGWTKPYFGMGTAGYGSTTSASTAAQAPTREWQKVTGLGGKVSPLTPADISKVLTAQGFVNPGTIAPGVPMSEAQKRTLLADRNKTNAQFVISKLYAEKPPGNPMFDGLTAGGYRRVVTNPGVAASAGKSSPGMGKLLLGAPPEVLYLSAYSNPALVGGQWGTATNIYRIPVVITNLGITYPNDVDYIPTMDKEPFPIIMSITLSLAETHSPREFEKFDIFKYRDGKLPGF